MAGQHDHGARARRLWCVAVAGVIAAALAGCGSDDNSSSASTAGGASNGGGSSNECVQQAQAGVKEATAALSPNIPSDSFDASKAKGKKVWSIVSSKTIPLHIETTGGIAAAAKAMGVDYFVFDGKHDPTVYNKGITQAINEHVDGIIIHAIPSSIISASLKKAYAAGITVVDLQAGAPDAPLDGMFAHLAADYTQDGKWTADYVLANSNCKADAAIVYNTAFEVLKIYHDGIEAEYRKLCPDCKLRDATINPNNYATDAGPLAQNLAQRDPKLNWIMAVNDAIVPFMVPSLKQVGAGDRVKIISHDGVEANLDLVRKQDGQVADIAYAPNDYVGWLVFDEAARGLAGAPAVKEIVPSHLFDKSNLPAKGSPLYPEFEGYQDKFKALWGLQ
jgi:ribose transport system substrate-binding protein